MGVVRSRPAPACSSVAGEGFLVTGRAMARHPWRVCGRKFESCGPTVRSLRRAFLALGVTGLIAAVLRLRGTGGVPPQTGGWRELSGPDLR